MKQNRAEDLLVRVYRRGALGFLKTAILTWVNEVGRLTATCCSFLCLRTAVLVDSSIEDGGAGPDANLRTLPRKFMRTLKFFERMLKKI